LQGIGGATFGRQQLQWQQQLAQVVASLSAGMEANFWGCLWCLDRSPFLMRQRIPEVCVLKGKCLHSRYYSTPAGMVMCRTEPAESVEEVVAACAVAASKFADGESETSLHATCCPNPDSIHAVETDGADDRRPVAILRGPFTDLDAASAGFASTTASVPLDVPHMALLTKSELRTVLECGYPGLGDEDIWSLQSLVLPADGLRVVSVYSCDSTGHERSDVFARPFHQLYAPGIAQTMLPGPDEPAGNYCTELPASKRAVVESKTLGAVRFASRFHNLHFDGLILEYVFNGSGQCVLTGCLVSSLLPHGKRLRPRGRTNGNSNGLEAGPIATPRPRTFPVPIVDPEALECLPSGVPDTQQPSATSQMDLSQPSPTAYLEAPGGDPLVCQGVQEGGCEATAVASSGGSSSNDNNSAGMCGAGGLTATSPKAHTCESTWDGISIELTLGTESAAASTGRGSVQVSRPGSALRERPASGHAQSSVGHSMFKPPRRASQTEATQAPRFKAELVRTLRSPTEHVCGAELNTHWGMAEEDGSLRTDVLCEQVTQRLGKEGSVRPMRCGLLPKIARQLEAYHDLQMKWELEVVEARTTIEQAERELESRGLEAEREQTNGGNLVQLEQARLVALCRDLTGKLNEWKRSQHTDNALLETSRRRLAERRRMLQGLRDDNQVLQNRADEVMREVQSKYVEHARMEQEEVMWRTLKNQRLEEAAQQTERGENALKAANALLDQLRVNVSSEQRHASKLSEFVQRFAHTAPLRSTSVGRKGRNVANGASNAVGLRREAATLLT